MRAAAGTASAIAAAAAVAASTCLGLASFRAAGRAPSGPVALGPGPAALDEAVSRALGRSIAALDDRSLDARERTSRYRAGLAEADALACRAVLASPDDARAIERLAGIRWERSVFGDAPSGGSIDTLIALAGERAPRVPDVQLELGRTLYKMGRADEASARMARAVALSPSMTNRAVAAMIDAGMPPSDVAEALGRTPATMAALKDHFLEAGRGAEFLDLVEHDLAKAPAELLWSYGEACLQLRVPARLRDAMAALPSTSDRGVAAERSRQRAHASHALGDLRAALEEAALARRLAGDDPSYAEFFGEIALASGRASDAAEAFRGALEGAVARGASPAVRSRLYREIGQSLEAEGRGDLAVDAFRHALALDPQEAYARSRVSSLEATMTDRNRR